jgi:cytoskeletal protein RodZ
MLETYEQNSKKKLIATVLAVIVIAGVVVLADAFKSKAPASATTASQTTSQDVTANDSSSATSASDTSDSDTSTTSDATYKDGSYSVTTEYYVPHGTESITVNLTLSSGTVTDVSIVNSENDHDSAEFQADFTVSYKSYVVGKKISGLQLSNVAGASDTTDGFNEALTKLEADAQA